MTRFGHCIHCREPLDSPDFHSCSRCCQLLSELGDTVVDPSAREPGSDDARTPQAPPSLNTKHDGKWLVWAANKRGQLRWFQHFGVVHGYPRNISQWSPGMVAVAVKAKMADHSKSPAS
jgi:hypothetical protein